MAGITISAQNVERFVPRALHEGVFSQLFRFEYNGVTVSASDVIVIGYLQQGVTVLSGQVWGGGSNTSNTFKFGVAGNDTALSAAVAVGAAPLALTPAFVPKAFSLSADAEGNLKLQVIATASVVTLTATGSINLLLTMTMAPP